MNTTPISLLERLHRADEEEAWSRFVQLYTPLLCQWAGRLGLQDADAADLVQDVFTVLVRKLPEFRYDPRKRFRGWLWTVLLNKWRERARRAAPAGGPEGLDELAGPDAADAVGEAEYRDYLIRRALELMQAEFEPTTWQAFWASVVAERPAAAVARELGISENAVYLAKGRVLRRLRRELAGLLD
jgi:RNA polymerase sigma-70 factor (ECF subfamily)